MTKKTLCIQTIEEGPYRVEFRLQRDTQERGDWNDIFVKVLHDGERLYGKRYHDLNRRHESIESATRYAMDSVREHMVSRAKSVREEHAKKQYMQSEFANAIDKHGEKVNVVEAAKQLVEAKSIAGEL